MIVDYIAIVALWVSIIVYAALGGADFGAGIGISSPSVLRQKKSEPSSPGR